MGIIGQLRSYADRRLRLPVASTALVLDVGGGDQPHWRADVVVDRYPEEDSAAQRVLGGAARTDRPLFAVDAAALPFRSRCFDYAVCSHTLEHVVDPAGAIEEMCRVASAGYIEVPDAGAAKVLDFPSHLWWCSLEDGVLVFRAKQRRDYDVDIARFVGNADVRSAVGSVMTKHFDRTIVALRWEQSVAVRVEGEPDLSLMEVPDADIPPHPLVARAGRMVSSNLARATWSSRRRRRPLRFGDVLDTAEFGPLNGEVTAGVYAPGAGRARD